jgi:hypothetical protein
MNSFLNGRRFKKLMGWAYDKLLGQTGYLGSRNHMMNFKADKINSGSSRRKERLSDKRLDQELRDIIESRSNKK